MELVLVTTHTGAYTHQGVIPTGQPIDKLYHSTCQLSWTRQSLPHKKDKFCWLLLDLFSNCWESGLKIRVKWCYKLTDWVINTKIKLNERFDFGHQIYGNQKKAFGMWMANCGIKPAVLLFTAHTHLNIWSRQYFLVIDWLYYKQAIF